jgi:RNA polymerase sigma-70 factor (ECF subfamily)
MNDRNPDNTDYFVRQLMNHRKRIYTFILTLVGNSSDADDIMQDTAALMWQKYHQTEEIGDFAALGMRIAHLKVLEFRKKQYKSKIQFNSELFESILGGAAAVEETLDERFEALQKCLSKLDDISRKLVQAQHQKGHTIKEIAASVNMSQHVAYKRIGRLHDQLLRSVNRTLKQEGIL